VSSDDQPAGSSFVRFLLLQVGLVVASPVGGDSWALPLTRCDTEPLFRIHLDDLQQDVLFSGLLGLLRLSRALMTSPAWLEALSHVVQQQLSSCPAVMAELSVADDQLHLLNPHARLRSLLLLGFLMVFGQSTELYSSGSRVALE